jgi:hypothetical protein
MYGTFRLLVLILVQLLDEVSHNVRARQNRTFERFLVATRKGMFITVQDFNTSNIQEHSQVIIFVPNLNFIAKLILRACNLETGEYGHDDGPHLQNNRWLVGYPIECSGRCTPDILSGAYSM